MNKIIVCDIDGTIADLSHRLHYIQGDKYPKWIPMFIKNFLNKFEFIKKYFVEKKDWKSFYDEVDKDEPIQNIIEMIENLSDRYEIIYCTGRSVISYEKTVDWIKENVKVKDFGLLMRKEGDYRPDIEVKTESLKKSLEFYHNPEVAFILDDRDSVVKKWRELGYTCLQVCEGKF